jgi:hypothetical protein
VSGSVSVVVVLQICFKDGGAVFEFRRCGTPSCDQDFGLKLLEGIIKFYICGSVHHQSILLNNQRDAALSSRIYSSLRGYSTCFVCFLHPSSGVQLKLQMQSWVQFVCRCGLNPLKDIQVRESISQCHGQIKTPNLAMT